MCTHTYTYKQDAPFNVTVYRNDSDSLELVFGVALLACGNPVYTVNLIVSTFVCVLTAVL